MARIWERWLWFLCSGALFLGGCLGSPDGRRGASGSGLGGGVQKSVEVKSWSPLRGEAFSFDMGVPSMLASSQDLLYLAVGGTKDLYSWRIEEGNVASAWVQHSTFTGQQAPADFDLDSGTRAILGLVATDLGVAAVLSSQESDDMGQLVPDGTKSAQLGLAVFVGQQREASSSTGLTGQIQLKISAAPVELSLVHSESRGSVVYAVLYSPILYSNRAPLIPWVDLAEPTRDAHGILLDASVGNLSSTLRFVKGAAPHDDLLYSGNMIGAIASLPDGRLALGKPEGIYTVAPEFVGAKASDNPRVEQDTHINFLDGRHREQWKNSDGVYPTEIGAMRLVGQRYLVMGFSDDGSGSGGMVYADAKSDPLVFETNISAPSARIRDIVTDASTAYLMSDDVIYGFDGTRRLFFKLLDNRELKSEQAMLQGALEPQDFKGGNLGDVPDDGTVFHALAPYADTLYLATDHGLYSLKISTESKSFSP